MSSIRTSHGPAGELLYLVPYQATSLPSVTKRDLEQASEAARAFSIAPGRSNGAPPRRLIRFSPPEEPVLDLLLADRDAASWACAIDEVADLATAHGLSVCLRVLALIDLMGTCAWLRPWFRLSRAGLDFHPALLQAAALAPLTQTGGFAETALQSLLPGGAAQPESTA